MVVVDSDPPPLEENQALLDLTLVGRIILDKPVFRSWYFVKNLEMEEVEGDRFIFSFSSSACRQRILDQAPWTIKGFPMVLKPWLEGETVFEVDLSTIPIWVQVHGLPMGQSSKPIVAWVAGKA